MKKKKSEFGKITFVEFLDAIYYFIGAVITAVLGYWQLGRMPTDTEFIILAATAAFPPVRSIFKKLIINSDGEKFKKESK